MYSKPRTVKERLLFRGNTAVPPWVFKLVMEVGEKAEEGNVSVTYKKTASEGLASHIPLILWYRGGGGVFQSPGIHG